MVGNGSLEDVAGCTWAPQQCGRCGSATFVVELCPSVSNGGAEGFDYDDIACEGVNGLKCG